MQIYRLTTSGRITIPKTMREKFNIKPGTRVKFEVEQDGIKIIPLATAEEIKANAGFLGMKGKGLLKALMEEKKIEREL